jgi:hypothetical protein
VEHVVVAGDLTRAQREAVRALAAKATGAAPATVAAAS